MGRQHRVQLICESQGIVGGQEKARLGYGDRPAGICTKAQVYTNSAGCGVPSVPALGVSNEELLSSLQFQAERSQCPISLCREVNTSFVS